MPCSKIWCSQPDQSAPCMYTQDARTLNFARYRIRTGCNAQRQSLTDVAHIFARGQGASIQSLPRCKPCSNSPVRHQDWSGQGSGNLDACTASSDSSAPSLAVGFGYGWAAHTLRCCQSCFFPCLGGNVRALVSQWRRPPLFSCASALRWHKRVGNSSPLMIPFLRHVVSHF